MPISFFCEDVKYNLKNRLLIKRWIKETIRLENSSTGSINYIFTSDNNLLRINKEYLKHNYYTDIITFNYCEENIISGDIYISIDTVANNAAYFGVTFIEELFRVMVHGILHLIGYNDSKDEEKLIMRQKENFYLERLKNLF